MSTQFDIFLYLSALLVLVIFGNHSIRKRVSCKSDGIKFGTFSTCCLAFVSSVVLADFVTFLMPSEVPFCTIFETKPFRKSLQKKGGPYSKFRNYERVRWLPGTPPRVRTIQTRNSSSSSNCCSSSCPWLWLRKIARKWLFELASIANVSKTVRKNGKG